LGARQSGLPDMRLADLRAHAELLQAACDDARLMIERDPDPQSERGAARPPLPLPVRRCGEDLAGGMSVPRAS
jgi:ATP-dependent DNA helicase RecG